MTQNPDTNAFRFEPNHAIKNTLSRFASDSSKVTLRLVDDHLSFIIDEDDCKVLATQQVERRLGHSVEPINFGIEGRLAKALYPLFPDPINAQFESDCLHIWRGNTSCRWPTTPANSHSAPILGDHIREQVISLSQVKAALAYCLPFSKKTHRQPIESVVHFQGDSVVTGKDSWGAAIVKFLGGPATPSFCLEAKNAVRLRDALNSMTGQVKLATGAEWLLVADATTSVWLPTVTSGFPPAAKLLNLAPQGRAHVNANDFVKALRVYGALIRPNRPQERATVALEFAATRPDKISVKVSNDVSPSVGHATDSWSVASTADLGDWKARVDLESLCCASAFAETGTLSMTPIKDRRMFYIEQSGPDLNAYAILVEPTAVGGSR